MTARLTSFDPRNLDVVINFMMPAVPFGGAGQSGQGVGFGAEGLRSHRYARGGLQPPPGSHLGHSRGPATAETGLRYWKTPGRILLRW